MISVSGIDKDPILIMQDNYKLYCEVTFHFMQKIDNQ